MGLNNKLDLELIGEGKPKFTHPSDKKNWNGLSLPWMAFGYGVELTPLQTLTFYNAIANDGKMVKPKFLKTITKHSQKYIKYAGPLPIKAVNLSILDSVLSQ